MAKPGGPDDGTIIIEPVENGWLVVHWKEPDIPEPDEDEDEDEENGYDPSAAFGAQMNEGQVQRHVVAHLHMQEPTPEPNRYVFTKTEDMLTFIAKLTTQTEQKKAQENKTAG